MKLLHVFFIWLCAVSVFAQNQNPENHVRLFFDGTPVMMDTINKIMYASVKPDIQDDFRPEVTIDLDNSDAAAATMTLALGNSGTLYSLPHTYNVTQWPTKQWVMRMSIGGHVTVWNLVVTTLPVVNIDVNLKKVDKLYAAELGDKTSCTVWMADPQGRLDGKTEFANHAMIKVSTFTNADYAKKPYALELTDSATGNEVDADLFGLRTDGDWVLDAMYCDPSRMRNRVVTDVWNSISSLPYDKEHANGAKGEFVELFVNSQYYGLYCFTEKIDRKALGVKKGNDESVNGLVLRAQKSNDATTLYDYSDEDVTTGAKWCGWTQIYPENGFYRWDLVKTLINVAGYGNHSWSNYSRLSKEFSQWFYMDNCVDYFLLLNSFYLLDNTNRNYYLSFYDAEKSFRALFTPGSLEGSLGRNNSGQTLYDDDTRSGFNSKIIKRIGFFNRMVTDNTLKFNNRLRSHWDILKAGQLSVEKVTKKINDYKKQFVRSGAFAREKAKWPDTAADDMDIEAKKMIDWYAWNYSIIDSYLTTNYPPYEGEDTPVVPEEPDDPELSGESIIPSSSNYAGYTVRPSNLYVNGMPAVVDAKNMKLYVALHPDSCTNIDYTITTSYPDLTLSVDGKQFGDTVKDHLTDCNDCNHCVYVKVGTGVAKYTLEFTTLPIVCIDTDWKKVLALSDEDREAKVNGYVYIVDAQHQTNGQRVFAHRIATKVRGASARDYDKKSLAMEIRDEEMGEMTEDAFILGIREDDDWVLDAMYVDKARMRNRTLTDIWNSFSDLPYDKDNEYQFNGTHGQHVELIINGKYNGLYCLTDKVDRKKLNLKKTQAVDENTVNIRGLLYKGKKWTDATNMHNYDINDTGEGSLMWQGYEQQYPDDTTTLATWEPLQDFLQLCCDENIKGLGQTYSRLSKEYQDYFYMENLVDYILFYNAFALYDNTMKNTFLSVRNLQKDKKMLFTPWDLDASLGRTPTAEDWSGDDKNFAFGRKLVYRNGLIIKLVLDNPFKFHTLLHTRWNKLKNAQLSVENVMKRFKDYAHKLETSGAWRREHNRWPEHADEDLQEEIQFIEKFYTKNHEMFEAYIRKYPSLMLEDVNGDGVIDTQDVLQIYEFMKNSTGLELTPAEDVNCDSSVDTQDVLEIYDYMKGN